METTLQVIERNRSLHISKVDHLVTFLLDGTMLKGDALDEFKMMKERVHVITSN